jgi:hypothetical protein
MNPSEIPEGGVVKVEIKIWCGGKTGSYLFIVEKQKTIGSFLERIERDLMNYEKEINFIYLSTRK